MDEEDYISYFENIAVQSKDLNHGEGGKESFFYIENQLNTEEVDHAIRGRLRLPAMLLETMEGGFDDNGSANYTDTVKGAFWIIAGIKRGRNIRQEKSLCKAIGLRILARMKSDSRRGAIVSGVTGTFELSEVDYTPITMADLFCGYVFSFHFVCPLAFAVDSGTWRDK